MSLAPIVAEAPDGTDYAGDSSRFVLGPVQLDSDVDRFKEAVASPGTAISASPRDTNALVIVKLEDAPAAEGTECDPPIAARPIAPIVLEAPHQKHAASLIQTIETGAEDEIKKAWHELKHLLHVG